MKLLEKGVLSGFGWVLLAVAHAVSAGVVLESDFFCPAGPLGGRDGWSGRSDAIRADGNGLAGLGESDGFVKRRLSLPENSGRVRLTAHVRFSALPGSAMRNHHLVGQEQPAWVALAFTDNDSPKAGLAAAKLSASVTSDGNRISIGLGRSVGAVAPEFGVHQASGDGCGELALEYDFAAGKASAFWNGSAVLIGSLRLQAKEVAWVGFQLRRMQPLGSTAPGGLDRIKVECAEPAQARTTQPVQVLAPELPLGSRINTEAERAREVEGRVDSAKTDAEVIAALRAGWANPPATYRPHTRWWWPGNAVTVEGLDWQLEQMKSHGMGGVEVMSFLSIYEKGNIGFGTPEFIGMVKHTVDKARELGMEVSVNLGPGWNHGNADVPEEDRSKVLIFAEQEVAGGAPVACSLALPKKPAFAVREKKRLEAVVAVALTAEGKPNPAQRVDLSASVSGERTFSEKPVHTLKASLPAGRWTLVSFWTAYTGQKCAAEDNEPRTWIVDHLKKSAVRDYAAGMGGRYLHAFGADFGQTVDSIFGDSYELSQDFSLWSEGLFERFQKEKGYDLRPYLPLLIFDGAPETPYVRYDFGQFLHTVGMEAAIGEMAAYCDKAGVHMRQQPHYRFTAELIEASGALQRPETELCRRSFEPIAYPHKLTTSGARLYPSKGRRWVSCEAFTFSNAKYRSTLEELKRGTDLFLRDGITQFYNHGYFYTPEKELEPARDLIWMNRISHVNTWWPWYRGLAEYQARAAFLSRQGRAQASVLLYAPMPTVWSERAEYPCSHVRDVPFGKLPKILVASGYDFDCVNDDLLANHTTVADGKISINGYSYTVLILPRVICLAPKTLQVVEQFVASGGTVFALNTLPNLSPGLAKHEENDAALQTLCGRLFDMRGGEKKTGRGVSYYLPECDGFEYLKKWSPGAKEWEPTEPLSPAYCAFIATLRARQVPDVDIAGVPVSDGLTFRHTQVGSVDCWFISNLQTNRQQGEVTLNTTGKAPQTWDAMTGEVRALKTYRFAADGRIVLPVALEPWESIFVLLTAQSEWPELSSCRVAGGSAAEEQSPKRVVPLSSPWHVTFKGLGCSRAEIELQTLSDWTAISGLADFSGTAVYTTEFDMKALSGAIELDLGSVHEVAAVRVNGQQAGSVWMQPYRVDISKQLRTGKNRLEIEVANLLWNYAAGLTKPTLIPAELQDHYGTTWKEKYNGWGSLQANKRHTKNDRMPSGLIGPVTLRIAERDPVR